MVRENIQIMENTCDECDGKGTVLYSCCGDTVTGWYKDALICSSCKEHLGDEEPCESCSGTGVINNE